MSRKLLNEVDGFIVDEFQGTFTGTFDVRGADAKYLAYDDEVMVVVRARVKPPRLKEMKNGDIVRVNVLQIKEAGVVRSDELKAHLSETLGLETPPPQLAFELTTPEPEDSVAEPEAEPEVFAPGSPVSQDLDGFIQSETPVNDRVHLQVVKFRADEEDSSDSVLAGFLDT